MIVEQTGDDLHLIESADAYPTDFDDVILFGPPMPLPLVVVLEKPKKAVFPLCTHGGYGASRSYGAVRNSSSGAAVEH